MRVLVAVYHAAQLMLLYLQVKLINWRFKIVIELKRRKEHKTMSMSPEQMRKKSLAQDEAERHARYAQADGSMKKLNSDPVNSTAISAQVARVNAATAKEDASIGKPDPSPNSNIRFQE